MAKNKQDDKLLTKREMDVLAQTKGMQSPEFMEAMDARLRADFLSRAKEESSTKKSSTKPAS